MSHDGVLARRPFIPSSIGLDSSSHGMETLIHSVYQLIVGAAELERSFLIVIFNLKYQVAFLLSRTGGLNLTRVFNTSTELRPKRSRPVALEHATEGHTKID